MTLTKEHQIHEGEKFNVYQWRNSETFQAEATSDPIFEEEMETYIIYYHTPYGNHYAVWDEYKERWNDGAM